MADNVQEFGKYAERGAYHWKELKPRIRRYNAGLAARYDISREIISRHCRNPGVVMDAGCGDGAFTSMLAGHYRESRVTGFDFDEPAIRLAREMTAGKGFANLSFARGNAFEQVKSAGLITATDVIEHIFNPGGFMEDSFRTLSPGGFLFLSTPVKTKEVPDDKYHVREFRFQELEEFSKSFGFAVMEHTASHPASRMEKYNKSFRFGLGKIRLYKYIYNALAICFKYNVFKNASCPDPAMQYILLRKP